MCKNKRRRQVILFILYCLSTFLFFEFACRVALSYEPFFNKILSQRICDAVWRFHWVKDHRQENKLFYSFDTYHPTRGWTLKPNLKDISVFKNKNLSSNSKGVRGKKEYSYSKPDGTIRILLIGDSYSFGEEVSDTETFAYYLEQSLDNVEVINLSIHGYGHDQMLLYLKEEGIKYHPDIIMLGYIEDDKTRNTLSFRDYAKPRFQIKGTKLVLSNRAIASPEDMLKKEKWRSRFFDLVSILYYTYLDRKGVLIERQEQLSKAILNEITSVSKGMGAVPIFIYLTGLRDDPEMDKYLNQEMRVNEKDFLEYWTKKGVSCIFPRPYLSEAKRNNIVLRQGELRRYGHFNPRENIFIAKGIKAFFTRNGILNVLREKRGFVSP